MMEEILTVPQVLFSAAYLSCAILNEGADPSAVLASSTFDMYTMTGP